MVTSQHFLYRFQLQNNVVILLIIIKLWLELHIVRKNPTFAESENAIAM